MEVPPSIGALRGREAEEGRGERAPERLSPRPDRRTSNRGGELRRKSHERPRLISQFMKVDPVASKGWGRTAAMYEQTRPGYSRRAAEFLAQEFDLGPGRVVVDVGAGTGKLTRTLLTFGARVIGVEPLPSMRRVFRTSVPGVRVMKGMAERLPLPDRSVDLVTAGQAWHWFDQGKALREFARVLRPGGGVALLYNFQDARSIGVLRVWKDLGLRPPTIPGYRRPTIASRVRRDGRYTRVRRRIFHEPLELQTPDQVVARLHANSWLMARPKAERGVILARAKELLEAHARRGGRKWLELPHDTEVVWFRLKPVARGMRGTSSARAPGE